ncbi:hypothetical protein FXO38_14322 [Capsicum annuum]|nr:hypothetical protein FXO38_14322 [Capsicum annuum]
MDRDGAEGSCNHLHAGGQWLSIPDSHSKRAKTNSTSYGGNVHLSGTLSQPNVVYQQPDAELDNHYAGFSSDHAGPLELHSLPQPFSQHEKT